MKDAILRRDVVKAAALMTSGAALGSSANSAVSVGLIGCGGRGALDAGHLVKAPQARLVAMCDIFDERIEKARTATGVRDARTYKNYQDLLSSDVDAVIIATPVFLHPEHFEAAVKAGKHIYIEKPAGVNLDDCRRIIRAADSAGRRLNIAFGFQQRYGPGYRKAKHLAETGGIGPIRTAHAHWIKGVNMDGPPRPKPTNDEQWIRNWSIWQKTSGGILVETYVHGVDVLNWFLGGPPLKANGTGGATLDRRGDIMDHVDVTFTYAKSVEATLTGSQIAPLHYRSVNEQFFGSTAVVETAREYWKLYRGTTGIVTEKEPRDITADAIEEFVRRIRDGQPENTAISGAVSTATAIMGQMAIDQKREVTWDELKLGKASL